MSGEGSHQLHVDFGPHDTTWHVQRSRLSQRSASSAARPAS